jgi:hypothetical protein
MLGPPMGNDPSFLSIVGLLDMAIAIAEAAPNTTGAKPDPMSKSKTMKATLRGPASIGRSPGTYLCPGSRGSRCRVPRPLLNCLCTTIGGAWRSLHVGRCSKRLRVSGNSLSLGIQI